MSEKIKLSERKGEYKASKNIGSYDVGFKFTLDDSGNIVSLKFSNSWDQLKELDKINIGSPDSIETEFSFADPNDVLYVIYFDSYSRGSVCIYSDNKRTKEEICMPFKKIS